MKFKVDVLAVVLFWMATESCEFLKYVKKYSLIQSHKLHEKTTKANFSSMYIVGDVHAISCSSVHLYIS